MRILKAVFSFIVIAGILMIGSYVYFDNEDLVLDELNTHALNGKFTTLTAGRTYYELSGPKDAELVVLVHGFSVPSYIWSPTKLALNKAGYQVLIFDLFGRGYSDRPVANYDMAFYVEQLHELLKSLDIKQPFNLVGLSMGGAVVTHYASKYAPTIKKLTLISPLIETPSKAELVILKIPLLSHYLSKVLMVPMLRDSLDRAVYTPSKFPHWQKNFNVQTEYKGFARAILKSAHYLDGKSFIEDYIELGKTDIPIQLFWGKQDQTIPFTDSTKVIEAIGHKERIEFISLDETGHLPHYEQPIVVNDKLITFLSK